MTKREAVVDGWPVFRLRRRRRDGAILRDLGRVVAGAVGLRRLR